MKKLHGILFDFNGTLFFDSAFHMEAFRQCFRKRGLRVLSDTEIIHDIFGKTNETIYREQYDCTADDDAVRAFVEEKEGIYRTLCLGMPGGMQFVPGAEELLDYLKEHHIPFCLVTGSGWENVSFYLEHMGLDRWFTNENLVYNDGNLPGKPAPDVYIEAAKRLGLTPENCLVFEDGTSGLLAAQVAGAGAKVALYEEWLQSPLTDDLSVDAVLHDLKNWKELLATFGLI